jgi:hypothetical protein
MHLAESFGNATTSTAILGYNRHAERVHAMLALDPKWSLSLCHRSRQREHRFRDAAVRMTIAGSTVTVTS